MITFKTRSLLSSVLLLFALLAVPAFAQYTSWQDIPIPALPAFHPKEPKRIALPNGMLTSFSGAIGVSAAYGATLLFRLAPPIDGFELPHIYPQSALLAVGSLAIAGIFAGLYPAARAAVLPPVEALRRE